ILVYHSDPQQILRALQKNGYNITQTERQTQTKKGEKKTSFHIYLTLPENFTAEIVIKDLEAKIKPEICEIYGDKITGLTLRDLQETLKLDPLRKFVPEQYL
ncbi:MAG: hypothetical protein QW279_14820, partial [Candidatus Jordarchaeaceae archaeon]